MKKKKQSKSLWRLLILNHFFFWLLIIFVSIAAIAFFLVPFLVGGSSYSREIPPLSYISIFFFVLCFWLLNKKTGIKE